MPFTGKPRTPDTDQLVEATAAAHGQVAAALKERQFAISRALHAGATLRELAGVLGVTPETVRNWGTTTNP